MANAMTTKQPPKTISGMLETYKSQIAAALPKHITPDRMARLALTAIRRNYQLGKADPVSLFGAIIQAAQLGLEPGINAHLVPFKNGKRGGVIEVQMIPDYRGLVAMARRSGEISRFKAEVVRENDEFDYEDGTEARLRHKPAIQDRGDIIGAYAIAKFKDGGDTEFVFMPREDIDAIRARSKSSGNGPWVTDYAAMAKKTVAKQLAKWLPVSVEMHQAIQLDDAAEAGESQVNTAVISGDYLVVDEDPTEALPKPQVQSRSSPTPAGNPDLVNSIFKAIAEASTEDEIIEAEDLIRELPSEEDRKRCEKAALERRAALTEAN